MHLPAREKLYASGVAIVLLAVISFAGMRAARPDAPLSVEPIQGTTLPPHQPLPNPLPVVSQAPPEIQERQAIVQLAGAVYRPGLIHLAFDSRLQDAINAAGGAKPDADLSNLNMAAKVIDSDSIYVPYRKDDPDSTAIEEAKTLPRYRVGGTNPSVSTRSSGAILVSVNAATAADFATLPGIGMATAEKIVAFRLKHGGFHSVDELQMVRGITPARYAEIRPYLQM